MYVEDEERLTGAAAKEMAMASLEIFATHFPLDTLEKQLKHLDQLDDARHFIEDAYEKVAEIGAGARWYDAPYLLLVKLIHLTHVRHFPWLIQGSLMALQQWSLRKNVYARELSRDRGDLLHRFEVPPNESVDNPDMWLCEIFTPSSSPALKAAIKKLGLDDRHDLGFASSSEEINRSRAGHGNTNWGLIGTLTPLSRFFPCGGLFQAIELVFYAVSPSVTAVVARFSLSGHGRYLVDAAWRLDHEPALVKIKGTWKVLDRARAGALETQGQRREIHRAARGWMSQHFPGTFASVPGASDQPLIDLLLFEALELPYQKLPTPEDVQAYDALGISGAAGSWLASEHLPGLGLLAQNEVSHPFLGEATTWSLWGNPRELHEQGELGADVSNAVDAEIGSILVRLSASEMLVQIVGNQARLRDAALSSHKKYRARDLGKLRASFLELSLDATAIADDVLWDADALRTLSSSALASVGQERFAGIDAVPADYEVDQARIRKAMAEQIKTADARYRDVLSTAAALGTSIDSFLLQRVGVLVAIPSFACTAVGLWLAWKLSVLGS